MLKSTPAMYDRGTSGSRKHSIPKWLTRDGVRIAVAIGLLACCGLEGLSASTPPVARGLSLHRTARAVRHRFTVHPERATVAANQTEHFEVTDAQGNSVAVRWNVSGLGCSGADCGTIDDQGVYRTPSSLPQPRVVILEGILVSDPNYSVLTEVRLEDAVAVTASSASDQLSTEKTQELTVTAVASQNFSGNPALLPLPRAIPAPPPLGKQNLARTAELPPPDPVAASPTVGNQNLASNTALPPLPRAIPAPPTLGKQNLARVAKLPPADPIAAPPAVGSQTLASGAALLPLSEPLVAHPVVAKQNVVAGGILLPMADVVAAAPVRAVSTQHAPLVTYRDGQLTIDTENSTLAAVLALVAEKTGAVIDVPPGSGLERIVEHTGPGRADDVLAQLLNGSAYDFIIVGKSQSPHDPAQVLLSLRRADTPASPPTQLPETAVTAPPWTTPAAPAVAVLPLPVDLGSPPPKEELTPEALGKLMRDKAREIREQIQLRQPQQ
jgi:hypothetical protein